LIQIHFNINLYSIKLPFNLFGKSDLFNRELLLSFNYSKKSQFKIFSDLKSDVELYGKVIEPEEADLTVYQNLLLYSYLKNKKNLNVLNVGIKKLASLKSLKSEHKISMLSFTDLCKNKTDITTDNFICYTKNELKKIKSNYDLIFFPSSQFTEETDSEINENVFSNLKYLLKPEGILLCSFTNIFREDSLWYENIFNHFAKQKNQISRFRPFSEIAKDPDLFYLPEKAYTKYWKEFTGKSYNEFGRAYCNNLIFENKTEVSQNNFDYFIYPKKTQTKLFSVSKYSSDLFNIKSPEKLTADHIRSLIIYAYIENNFEKNSKILFIGNIPEQLLSKLSEDFSLYKTENINFPEVYPDFKKNIKSLSPNDCSKEVEIRSYSEFFDFIFYFNGDFTGNVLNPGYKILLRHLNNLLNPSGSSIISFKITIRNSIIHFPPLLSFILRNNLQRLSKHVKRETILADDELLSVEVPAKSGKERGGINSFSSESFYNILFKKEQYLSQVSLTKHTNNLNQYPVYIFHHLMKCGGTSLFNALDQWFKTLDDNILDEDLNVYLQKKYNTEIFHSDVCLRAHFQKEGIYLHQRYPEVIANKDKFRIFSFIRDPLSVKISKYYFLKSLSGKNFNIKLRDSILKERNFLSGLFPCNESNYKEMLDRYYFIGIVEKFQESFDIFAAKTGKRKIILPKLNTSEKDEQMVDITPEFKKLFRELNELDYKIYEYCLKKFEDQKNSVLNQRSYL